MEEIIEEDRTGFVFEEDQEALEAIKKISTLDRQVCRKAFEERFSSQRMVQDYVEIYKKVINRDR